MDVYKATNVVLLIENNHLIGCRDDLLLRRNRLFQYAYLL